MSTPVPGASVELFVYGTLLRGERNHGYLEGCAFLRETATQPGFRLVDLGGYPGMVKAAGGCVAGELYRVSAPALAAIDELEQHPVVYWRTEVRLVDRRTVQTYLLHPERARGRPPVPEGDWRSYRLATEAEAR
jgi:gamma-glutamylcyclotransferase (GGCT)/AIG2-like uncharacterized protein YtfP